MMTDLFSSPRVRRGLAAVVLAAGALTGLSTSTASEVGYGLGPIERPAAYSHEILSVDEAINRLHEAEHERELVRVVNESVLIEHLDLSRRKEQLSARSAAIVEQVAEARRDARTLSVDAFISGGPMADTSALMASVDANELAWRNYLLVQHSLARIRVASRLEALRLASSVELFELGYRVDDTTDRLERAQEDLRHADYVVSEAETEVGIARAWQHAHSAVQEAGRPAVSDSVWAELRHCESRGRYRAVSPSGRYRGAYQFDVRTWISVGGTGDPIDAPPEEQDARARILFAKRGSAPWPNCGPQILP